MRSVRGSLTLGTLGLHRHVDPSALSRIDHVGRNVGGVPLLQYAAYANRTRRVAERAFYPAQSRRRLEVMWHQYPLGAWLAFWNRLRSLSPASPRACLRPKA